MKFVFIFLFFLTGRVSVIAQGATSSITWTPAYEFLQLYKLDSLGNSSSTGRYFGSLYCGFLQSIEKQLASADSGTKQLVRHFECVFAQFFIDACNAHQQNQPISIQEWRAYFSEPALQPIQYKLLGTNAHLNGGLWQALTHSFTKDEMQQLKSEFVIFKKSLNLTYTLVYHEAVDENKKIRSLVNLTIGIPKWIGNYYLYKWRKRQMRLARFYWAGSPKYSTLAKKVNIKKRKIDWLIIHTI